MSGATIGAARAGQVSTAIARTRSLFSVVRRTVIRPTGTISAPPMPCTTRAAMSTGRSGLAAQASEAIVNRAIATSSTRRVPKRSASQPLSGISTATVMT
jgi:hypothetical protein